MAGKTLPASTGYFSKEMQAILNKEEKSDKKKTAKKTTKKK